MVPDTRYPVYLAEHFRDFCIDFHERTGRRWTGRLPGVFTRDLIRDHNFVITSSVLVDRALLDETGGFNCLPKGREDVDLWLRCLEHVDCLHVHEPLIYYDGRRGGARRGRDARLGRRIAGRVRRLLR